MLQNAAAGPSTASLLSCRLWPGKGANGAERFRLDQQHQGNKISAYSGLRFGWQGKTKGPFPCTRLGSAPSSPQMAILGSGRAAHDTQRWSTEIKRNVTQISCYAVWGFNHNIFLQNSSLLILPLHTFSKQCLLPAWCSVLCYLPSSSHVALHVLPYQVSPEALRSQHTSCAGATRTPDVCGVHPVAHCTTAGHSTNVSFTVLRFVRRL